jgi:hypothetical protein
MPTMRLLKLKPKLKPKLKSRRKLLLLHLGMMEI